MPHRALGTGRAIDERPYDGGIDVKALTWQGPRDVRVEEVPEPSIQEPTDAIIRVTTSGICGSDLHLYEVLGPFLKEGDILGHEPMGIVQDVGSAVTNLSPGDRVVIPFQSSCGKCWMCDQGLQTQCETIQVRDQGMGAALYGYTQLYAGKYAPSAYRKEVKTVVSLLRKKYGMAGRYEEED